MNTSTVVSLAAAVGTLATVVIAAVSVMGFVSDFHEDLTALHVKVADVRGDIKLVNNRIENLQRSTSEITNVVKKADADLRKDIVAIVGKADTDLKKEIMGVATKVENSTPRRAQPGRSSWAEITKRC